MRFVSIFARIAFVVGVFLAGSDAMAGPVRCSVNNQDSTCVGHLTTAWQAAPTCPNQPGWTTIASAQWIGSQYSAPQCNYQAPPTCPTGFTQTAAPTWNGSNWVGIGCAVPPPAQGIPPGTPESLVCLGAAATVDPWGTPDNSFMHWSSDLAAGQTIFGSLSGPTYGSVNDTYSAWFNSFPWQNIAQINYQAGGTPNPGTAMVDMWVGGDSYGGTVACWVTPGTTNVLGVQYYNFQYETNGG
ncbi:hypothetical protein R75461_07395 [Paraburkholderia nemoris]|nr:hypothetical protein [Paraburkholderia aspalathi]MBK3786236.1 hypothetical protein [Paraburkholderia aspalathi]CAE6849355.1 hypothetical protein R75461_07395 [Paraburkholderia nemoris]